MADVARRRQLVLNDIENFDSCLTFDVNEYCIENWPTLTLKNRQAVWASLQNDPDFDWDSITDQIDTFIYEEAERNPRFVINNTDDETDEDDDEDDEYTDQLRDALANYVLEYWDDMDQEDEETLDDLYSYLITTIDEAVDEYYSDDSDETDSESNDQDKPVD